MSREEQTTLKEIKEVLEEILKVITTKYSTTKVSALDPNCRDVITVLNSFDISHNINGYAYWEYAITWTLEQKKTTLSITKELYPHLATKFDTTPSRVDRALRHAIQSTFKRNPNAFSLLFPSRSKSPTVSEFLFRIVDYLNKG